MPADTPTVTYEDNEDSSGVTATISGSTAGSTNKVLGARWSAGMLPVAFSQLASRVGDGTVSVPVDPIGLWFAVVRSEVASNDVALSAISSFRATDGEAPLHYQCCQMVQQTIQALSLESIESANVVIMKLPWRAYTEIGSRGIIISPIREDLESDDNERDEVGYRVQVAFLEAADGALTEGLETQLLRRQRVARAFSEIELPGDIPGHYIVYVEPGPVIIPEGVEAHYDVGAILLRCMCKVERGVS